MKNEEIVAKLREALVSNCGRIMEPLDASKYEHVFIIDKDIPDCNDTIKIEVTIQSNKNIPQAIIETETKTTKPPKGYSKEINIDVTPTVVSLIDDASFSEVSRYISDLAYNLCDVINEYDSVTALAELESNILMVSRGLYDYTIILPETNTSINYNVIESDEDSVYGVCTRFNGQTIYAKSAHSIVGAVSAIKDIYPKDISECWWRLDLISLMTKLFNVKEPKILDNKTYVEYIGEFSLPTNRKIDCNCWLKVTKSNINEQSKLYIESNTLAPYISIKVALDGFDNIVSYAYNAMNKIAGIIRILDTMKIDDGMTLYQLLARACKPNAHIEITCHNSNMVLISYYENGKYNNIWVSFPSHNRPNITIGNNYEISEACDSLEEAVIKVITEARKDK